MIWRNKSPGFSHETRYVPHNTSEFAHEVWDIKLFLAERLGRDPGIDNNIWLSWQ